MKRASTIGRGLIWAATLLLTLSACATVPEKAAAPAATTEQRARAAERDGDHAAAARAYLEAAAQRSGPERYDLYLDAAEAFYRGNFLAQAKGVLQSLPAAGLSPPQHGRRSTLIAALAVQDRNPRAALDALKDALRPDTPPALRAEVHRLRAAAHSQAGNVLEAARERIALAPLLADDEARRGNDRLLWQTFTALPAQLLEQLRDAAPPSDAVGGWAALALIARAPPAERQAALAEWRILYPQHAAPDALIAAPPAGAPPQIEHTAGARPTRIALLLPLSGGYAAAATAVRDGFLAAYFEDSAAPRPAIRIYDGGDNAATALQLYARAVADGADVVVGPLAKEAVSALKQAEVPVPTLALNYGDDQLPAPPRLFQFGLSPEQEAQEAAERAWLDGHAQALVIAPGGDWGKRVAQAFSERWLQLGGRVAAARHFEAGDGDFSEPVRRLLNIDDSQARARALRALLQTDLKFEPRRRTDADFIFMAAFPREARQLPPLLKFFYAGDLPVYATSHVYEGQPNPAKDRDLDGVVFADMPWLLRGEADPLREAVEQAWPNKGGLRRLYALGVDAYRILPLLGGAADGATRDFTGATGRLRADPERRVQRGLVWARFSRGEPVPLAAEPVPAAAPQ